MHAELVVAARGVLHLADRSSANGTWYEAGGDWMPIRQRIVLSSDRLRFGQAEITVAELLNRIPERPENPGGTRLTNREAASPSRGRTPGIPDDELPRGRVRRNPLTGEVVGD